MRQLKHFCLICVCLVRAVSCLSLYTQYQLLSEENKKTMDDIRNALLKGDGNKLSKKQYKFAVELEKSRLL